MEIITGGQPFRGEIIIPPSKSISHRAIIAAGLSNDNCRVSRVLNADDLEATLECLMALGIDSEIEQQEEKALSVLIKGTEKAWRKEAVLQSRESGSTLRFMIPIAMAQSGQREFCGMGRLVERPITPYIDMFQAMGIDYTYDGRLPLKVNGGLSSGTYKVPGNISSQFITGLLMALPLLEGNSKIVIEGELESASYVDLTLDVLSDFGVEVERIDNGYRIEGGQAYKANEYVVEGDFSQAAFFIAAGLLGQEPIVLKGLTPNSKQGDRAMIDIVRSMGGRVEWEGENLVVYPSVLKGAVVDLKDCPDLGPIVSVLGALAKGQTRIVNAQRLRIKESDRLAAMTSELKKLGAKVKETEDGMLIEGVKQLMGATVESWNDHRIVMALTVGGIRTFGRVKIRGAEAVKKSYPAFFKDVRNMGGRAEEVVDPLNPLRNDINKIDQAIVELLKKRFEVVSQIAEIKKRTGMEIFDSNREQTLLKTLKNKVGTKDADVIEAIYDTIFKVSRGQQAKRLNRH